MSMFQKKILGLMPALVMVAGAGSLYLANILLAAVFDAQAYGVYALLITLISVVFSFGLLGGEQVFVRVSKISDGVINVSRQMLVALIIAFGLVLPAIVVGVVNYFDDDRLLVCLILIGQVFLLFIYNLLRVTKNFLSAQINASLWKLVLLFAGVYVFFSENKIGVTHLLFGIGIGTWVAVVYSICVYIIVQKKITVTAKSGDSVLSYFFPYFISLGSLTVLGNFDRYLIAERFGAADFGRYFYVLNLYVSPFLIVASYIGFSQVVKYKVSFSLQELNKDLYKLVGGVLAAALLYWMVLGIVSYVEPALTSKYIVAQSTLMMVLLFLMIFVRAFYSVLSSAMGAVGRPSVINMVNALSVLVMILVASIATLIEVRIFEHVVFCCLLMWVARCGLFYWGVGKSA